eukprot:TRINITY_DN8417_c0_g1_i1.p1 TRINITY_DN8417_c0_g1~~TRINITY_DN8417_c0_g1_i1.p1  ORF type:complete len:556 (+),score=93.99 TRINITY_DN8417_c0_g1_i1:31-1668(+)
MSRPRGGPEHEFHVVSLVPAVTDALCRLGVHHYLVGRSRSCQWPPIALRVPVVALNSFHPTDAPQLCNTDIEDANLVLVPENRSWRYTGSEAVKMVPCVCKIRDAIAVIMTIGSLINEKRTAQWITSALLQRLDRVEQMAREHKRNSPQVTKVAVLQGLSESVIYSCGYWMPEAVRAAGGVCVGVANKERRGKPMQVTLDILADLQPDIIVIGGSGRTSAEQELVESGLQAGLTAIARVYLPIEGGDAAIGLSGAGKEGGALAVAAVEAIAELVLDSFGTQGQLVEIGKKTRVLLPPTKTPASPPPQESAHQAMIDPMVRAVHGSPDRASSMADGFMYAPYMVLPQGSVEVIPSYVPSEVERHERKPRHAGHRHDTRAEGFVASPITPHPSVSSVVRKGAAMEKPTLASIANTQDKRSERKGNERVEGGHIEKPLPVESNDPKGVVYKQIRLLREGRVGLARDMYSVEARVKADAKFLKDLAPLLQHRLRVGAPSAFGEFGTEGCIVRVPVSCTISTLVWEVVYTGDQWEIQGVVVPKSPLRATS